MAREIVNDKIDFRIPILSLRHNIRALEKLFGVQHRRQYSCAIVIELCDSSNLTRVIAKFTNLLTGKVGLE